LTLHRETSFFLHAPLILKKFATSASKKDTAISIPLSKNQTYHTPYPNPSLNSVKITFSFVPHTCVRSMVKPNSWMVKKEAVGRKGAVGKPRKGFVRLL